MTLTPSECGHWVLRPATPSRGPEELVLPIKEQENVYSVLEAAEEAAMRLALSHSTSVVVMRVESVTRRRSLQLVSCQRGPADDERISWLFNNLNLRWKNNDLETLVMNVTGSPPFQNLIVRRELT